MSVRFSGRNIHIQFVDDSNGVTLAAVSTVEDSLRKENPKKAYANLATATVLGKIAAERALEKNIKAVVFDRGGSLYHGKIKALADAARAAGLQF
jgi:large subunit ribosomal protein L18